MFLYDKYSPKSVDELIFNKDVAERAIRMSSDVSIPNIILYGPDGAGKKTMLRLLMESIFDKRVNETNDINYSICGSGNKTSMVPIRQSNFHIVIEPNNNNFDKYLIQNIVNEYARRVPLEVMYKSSKPFKVVLINDVENLSYYAQMSLRRTMEKYSHICRFLMICNALSKVIDPLRSRCVCIRVPAPTKEEIIHTILNICYHENIDISLRKLNDIVNLSDGNIKNAIWLLECVTRNLEPNNTYIKSISQICSLIMKKSLANVNTIRKILYDMLITNIPCSNIIKNITLALCNSPKISDDKKRNIIIICAHYEKNLVLGRREMFHLDGMVVEIISILSE